MDGWESCREFNYLKLVITGYNRLLLVISCTSQCVHLHKCCRSRWTVGSRAGNITGGGVWLPMEEELPPYYCRSNGTSRGRVIGGQGWWIGSIRVGKYGNMGA